MSNALIDQLDELSVEASASLASATNMPDSEAWYREFLSRQGKLTGLLKGLGQLPAEERPLTGQKANQVKNANRLHGLVASSLHQLANIEINF